MTTSIHHATKAKAEKIGVILSHQEDDVKAHNPNTGRFALYPDAKVALALVQLGMRFGHEYPRLQVFTNTVEFVAEDGSSKTELVDFDPTNFDENEVFAAALEAAQEKGFDPEEGAIDQPDNTGSIVPNKYKQAYKERGNVNHCGDWLSKELDGEFRVTTDQGEEFDWKAFEAFLVKNGVEISGKWSTIPERGGRGWAGRYRMNGRQRLEKVLAIRGTYFPVRGDKETKVPPKALKELRLKHPSWDEAEVADKEAA